MEVEERWSLERAILLTRLDTANPPKKGALHSIKQNLSLKPILVLRNSINHLVTLLFKFLAVRSKKLITLSCSTQLTSLKAGGVLALVTAPKDIGRVLTTETRFRTAERH